MLVKQKIKTNLNSTRLDDHAEISIIEAPQRIKSPEKVAKPKPNTPRSKVKPSVNVKRTEIEPSPSVLTKKKPTPKSTKKPVMNTPVNDSSVITRPRRNAVRRAILDSDSDKENDSDEWSDSDTSYSDSDLLTDDDSDETEKRGNSKDSARKPKSVRKNAPSATKRPAKKKNDLIYLDLSSEEIVQVDENLITNVSEEDLANITRKFLEADLNDE